jgi:cysteine-rich repeat protein
MNPTAPINPTKTPTISIKPTIQPTNGPSISPTRFPTSPKNPVTGFPTSPPSPFHCCGNGIIEEGEECDNGPLNNNIYGMCMENCKIPKCGDGVIHLCDSNCTSCESCLLMEECDDGNLIDGDGCSSTCKIECPINQNENEEINRLLSVSLMVKSIQSKKKDDCETMKCLSPPFNEIMINDKRNEFSLVYWINNYCTCIDENK